MLLADADIDLLPTQSADVYVQPETLAGTEMRDGVGVDVYFSSSQLFVDVHGTPASVSFERSSVLIVAESQAGRVTLAGRRTHDGVSQAALLHFYDRSFMVLLHSFQQLQLPVMARRIELLACERLGPIISMEDNYLPRGRAYDDARGTWLGIFGEDAGGSEPLFLHRTSGIVRVQIVGSDLHVQRGGSAAMILAAPDATEVRVGDLLRPAMARVVPSVWLRVRALFDELVQEDDHTATEAIDDDQGGVDAPMEVSG